MKTPPKVPYSFLRAICFVRLVREDMWSALVNGRDGLMEGE